MNLFVNTSNEDEIYPATISEIAAEQHRDHDLKDYFKKEVTHENKKFCLKLIDDTDIVVYQNKCLVIPKSLQSKVVTWYHHYLMHPGHTRLEETIAATMY